MTLTGAGEKGNSGVRLAAAVMSVAAAAAMVSGCATPKPKTPLIQAPSTCMDTTISIYFEPKSAAVTRAARNLLNAEAANAKRCVVTSIDVKGLADSAGSPDANLELSRQRADAVTLALHDHGFGSVTIVVAASGDVGAQTTTGEAKPLRRRADVTFHLTPKAP
jgi:peptidoglycan-associated lipoprotein